MRSRRAAEKYLAKVVVLKKENRYFEFFEVKKSSKIKFNELLNEYLEKIEDQKFYQDSLRYFVPSIREFFGDKFLSQIDFKMLEDYRDMRKRTPTQHGTERSDRTVDIEMSFLRKIFKKGVQWDRIDRNPFDKGKLFYGSMNSRERALTEDEVKRLVEACPSYLKPIVMAGIYTGLRKGDLLSLKWENVDLEKALIRLTEQKTGKTRNIVLSDDMLTLLKGLPVRGEYVFPGKDGKPFGDVKRSFQTALKDAGIKQSDDPKQKIVFHSLRHTCVSLLHERKADTSQVQTYVGHASVEMTKHYTHLTDEYKKKTGNLLNGLFDVTKIPYPEYSQKKSPNSGKEIEIGNHPIALA